jgi:hypothetical protein
MCSLTCKLPIRSSCQHRWSTSTKKMRCSSSPPKPTVKQGTMVYGSSQNKGKTVNVCDNHSKTYYILFNDCCKLRKSALCVVGYGYLSWATCYPAHATLTLLPLAMTVLYLCSLSILFRAVLLTQRTRFLPCSTTFFDVLCSGYVSARWKVARRTPLHER